MGSCLGCSSCHTNVQGCRGFYGGATPSAASPHCTLGILSALYGVHILTELAQGPQLPTSILQPQHIGSYTQVPPECQSAWESECSPHCGSCLSHHGKVTPSKQAPLVALPMGTLGQSSQDPLGRMNPWWIEPPVRCWPDGNTCLTAVTWPEKDVPIKHQIKIDWLATFQRVLLENNPPYVWWHEGPSAGDVGHRCHLKITQSMN